MKLSQTSFISFLLSTILLFYAMNKIHILILSVITFTCFSCQKQNPKTQLEEIAINFCESFYNFNYPVAEEWSTPSSLSNPINGKAERFSSLQDTLQLIKEGNKWLVRKDIPLQNGKQNHD